MTLPALRSFGQTRQTACLPYHFLMGWRRLNRDWGKESQRQFLFVASRFFTRKPHNRLSLSSRADAFGQPSMGKLRDEFLLAPAGWPIDDDWYRDHGERQPVVQTIADANGCDLHRLSGTGE
jgi:hypothetical protein